MRKLPTALLAVLGGIALSATAVAQDSAALVDLLVKKGLINDQEAEEVRAELTKDFVSNTSAGKLSLGSQVTEFKLSGDVRLRHQYDATTKQGASASLNRTRERFRFRLNGDAKLANGWGAGFAFETANAADSGNQTIENANADYNFYLARAYISYQATNDLFLVGGKFKNLLETTDLVWDGDINPQGLGETYSFAIPEGSLQFRASQLMMDDNDERAGSGYAYRDSYLFVQQLVYSNKIAAATLTVAPGYMFYNNASITGNNNETAFDGRTKGLSIATFTGSLKFADIGAAGNSLSLYWDSTYNFDADTRVHDIYGLSDAYSDGATSWLVGIGYAKGSGKLQGDWSVKADYRRIGIGSLDPNLSDSDFGFGNLNQQGFKLSGSYNLTSFASVGLTYFHTWDVQGSLKQSSVATLDKSSILQLDLVTKF